MWRRKFKRFLKITAGIIIKILTIDIIEILTIIWKIVMKGFRVIQQPKFRHPLLYSSGVMGITAILVISVTGLLNYKPDTSVPFLYVPPPAGERNYYMEATPEGLWDEFLSPYSEFFTAQQQYVGKSFIFKDILIDEHILNNRYKAYIVINLIQFVPCDILDLQNLKEGDVVDITGVCTGLSNTHNYVIVGNCQFHPAGLVPLPLPGGPAPLAPSY